MSYSLVVILKLDSFSEVQYKDIMIASGKIISYNMFYICLPQGQHIVFRVG